MSQAAHTAVPCIGVLAGGCNEERGLSLQGGRQVYDALVSMKMNARFIDWQGGPDLPLLLRGITVCFNCLHGNRGEDGTVAGLLEIMGIPYTFSGVFGSACGSDKGKSKELLSGSSDVQVVPGASLRMKGLDFSKPCPVEFPVMVKDPAQGSSKGVWLCRTQKEYENALGGVSGSEAVVEKFISGSDIVVCLLDEGDKGVTAWPVMEFETDLEWQDEKSKNALWGWGDGGGQPKRPAIVKQCPPRALPAHLQKKAVAMARAIYHHLRARTALNVEFRVSGEDMYFIEVSIVPALTSTSVHATCAQAAGVSYPDLVARWLKTARLDGATAKL